MLKQQTTGRYCNNDRRYFNNDRTLLQQRPNATATRGPLGANGRIQIIYDRTLLQ
jgi:hypothetical protein